MKKWLKRALLALVILFIVVQVIRPSMTNPPVDESRTLKATAQIPPETYAIMERACNDCHSNKTEWPWYSQMAPVSWYLSRHIAQGRRELNLSDWARFDDKRKARKLDDICEQVKADEMPLKSYLLIHPSAKLSDADKQAICNWTEQERARLAATQISNPPANNPPQ